MQGSNTKYLMTMIAVLFALGLISATILAIAIPDAQTMIGTISLMVSFGTAFLMKEFRDQKVEEKLDDQTRKLDANTALTKAVAVTAEKTAEKVETEREEVAEKVQQAVQAADNKTAESLEGIKGMLNGEMDKRITRIVKAEIKAELKAELQPLHADMNQIKTAITQLMNRK
jgi:hypothetical protein